MNAIGRRKSHGSIVNDGHQNSTSTRDKRYNNETNNSSLNLNFNSINSTSDIEISEPNRRRWNPVQIPVSIF